MGYTKIIRRGQLEQLDYYQNIVDKFNSEYGDETLKIEIIKNDISSYFEIIVNKDIELDYESAFENMLADERYLNPENPYDKEYPFSRKKFVEEYEKSQKYGVAYTEYKEGLLEGKYVELIDTDSPFRLEKSPELRNGNVKQRDDGSAYIAYYDSDGTIERIYSAPVEAVGMNQQSKLFFAEDLEGYKILANEFNRINGETIAQIFGDDENGYHLYMDPNWTNVPGFYDRFSMLQNAIACDYHPALTKVEALRYIKSEDMRTEYMQNPSREVLTKIFDIHIENVKEKNEEENQEVEEHIVTPKEIAEADMEKQLTTTELTGFQKFIQKLKELKDKIFGDGSEK